MDFSPVIKSAIDEQIKALNGVEAAAALVGMGKSQLAAYRHPDRGERVPLVVAMQLDEVAGKPVVLERAAALLGYRLVRIDQDESDADIAASLGVLAMRAGQLISEGIEAGKDRVYTRTERRQLGQRVAEIQGDLARFVAALGSGGE